ncbi:hypothetical protein EG329_005259 [Mollisiaceae sp. DMI_Dod_QoI]|nr:hypothetical protein EG329_005259 [Helotiales sp. DMI_Dod_QoI]
MLEGSRFREGKELKEHGSVKIELSDPEDDPTAMMIILGILYGDDVQVPIELDLPTLCKVAVLADKYQWHALVTPHVISWFDIFANSHGLPTVFNTNLLMCLWIAWLFRMKDHFKSLSRVAQEDACTSIDLTDESIRLPASILKAINEQRDVAFQKIEQVIHEFKETLLDGEKQKDSTLPEQKMVKYMVFGHAIFYSQDLELGEFSRPNHAGSSIRLLRSRISLFQSVEGFNIQSSKGTNRHVAIGGSWDLRTELQKAISDLKIDEWGLDYDDFKQSFADGRSDA